MGYNKIQVLIFFLMLVFINKPFAQITNSASNYVINNLYSIKEDSANKFTHDDDVYIVYTNKNCIACFPKLCHYYSGKRKNIYAIVFTEKNYLSILPLHNRIKKEIPCAKEVFFYFFEDVSDDKVKSLFQMPSPQVIIKTTNGYQHIGYKDVMSLIY